MTDIAEKITIQLEDDKAKRVRDKDITLLHPGPLARVASLEPGPEISRDLIEETWELLSGEAFSLQDLAELLFEDFTPQTAWATWQQVTNGLHFEGSPERLRSRSHKSIAADLEKIEARQREEAEKLQFYAHIENACLDEMDRKKLAEVEMLALGKTDRSNILRTLDIKQTRESAHQFLISCGYWEADFNPHPARADIELQQPLLEIDAIPDEDRLDLTALNAFAIDDAGSNDPDDAISLDGDYFWVHVADVAALVRHDSDLDLEARRRAANLYLPEVLVHMLPEPLTHSLGLGLQETSPALSIGFRLTGSAEIVDVRIVASWIRVQRLSYETADGLLDTEFARIKQLCDLYRTRRKANKAAEIDLPEVSVRIRNNEIQILPLDKLGSRQMVTDAMIMAGQAVAKYCQENNIPVPYATQPGPEEYRDPAKISEMYAYRRLFKASKTSLEPEPHAGLGLEYYTRATSPLRRYMDLVVHQQLRAFLAGDTPLTTDQLVEKMLSVDQQSAAIRRAERLSNLHWKLVFLQRNPQWQGDAVIVDVDERKSTIIIPDLALEAKIRTRESFGLDDTIRVQVSGVNLSEQTAFFQYLN